MNRIISILPCYQQHNVRVVEKIILSTAIVAFCTLSILAVTSVLPLSIGTGMGMGCSFVVAVALGCRLYNARHPNNAATGGHQNQDSGVQNHFIVPKGCNQMFWCEEIDELYENRQLNSLSQEQLIKCIHDELPDFQLIKNPDSTFSFYLKDEPLSYYGGFKKEKLLQKLRNFLNEARALKSHIDPKECIPSVESLHEMRSENILNTASKMMQYKIAIAKINPERGDLFISEGMGRFVFYHYYTIQEGGPIYKDTLICNGVDFEKAISLSFKKDIKAIYNITKPRRHFRIARAANWEDEAEFRAQLQHLYFTKIP